MKFLISPIEMPCTWSVMWHEFQRSEGMRVGRNKGEVWEYLGSQIIGDVVEHSFRHKCNPRTGKVAYRKLLFCLLTEEIRK
jgi:hypothetical protein